MLEVFILTSRYPYGVGEEFFADELAFWAKRPDVAVTIFPLEIAGNKRPTPREVSINEILALKSSLQKYTGALSGVLSKVFLQEIVQLFFSKRLSIGCFRSLVRCAATTNRVEKRLADFIEKNKTPDVIYSYWNEAAAYGACLLKRKGLVRHVISRAHGSDLYQERRPESYAPLKRSFVDDFDKVYVLAPDAGRYFVETYGANPRVVQTAPLGVKMPSKHGSPPRKEKKLSVLSLSYCVPIKRIDKIIDALASVSHRMPDWKIQWTHVGGGPLLDQIIEQATAVLGPHGNLTYRLTGALPNEQVKKLLASGSFDVIVNSSESEGIPVSLMEAMSYGILVIAPDVGEVRSLVSTAFGILLSRNPTPTDIGDAIIRIATTKDRSALHAAAREKIDRFFNEEKNYPRFISSVVDVAAS